MPAWSVVRSRQGSAIPELMYRGRLKWRAEETYDRAKPEPGTLTVLYEHRDGEGRKELRRSDQVVTDVCSRCERPITGDLVPARDLATNRVVCDDCTRIERHVRRAS